MRTLLIILSFFLPTTLMVEASGPSLDNIENINLNIKDHEVAVTFLGLSAGEATLIQGANNENTLINTGGKETAAELEGWLFLYDVKEISKLILTHNGTELSKQQLNRLISKYNIKEIISTPKFSAKIKKELDSTNKPAVVSWGQGTKRPILPEMTAEVQFVGNDTNEGMDLTLDFFNHRIFLMTSFTPRAEETLLEKNLENINVFKIPNGAPADSLSEKLIQYLNPQISVLFSPEEEAHDPDILVDLHETWSEIYSTKKHGTITIKFTESNYEIITIPIETDE
ncbi:ATP-dependent DNA helicase [Bacillus sp. AFS073361]|uniref:ATP-dependent DNA helicase n=1 Tax=Bacillus sp. AFS073361 TaxID=2033511 RepID=UPI000BF72817|nr:ATP-dependent DNA helicase [Bacillus sp. AFS073361]PFP27268.1 ATP-dependent DNA helicase [Bacillus sp. AFS073361]